MKNRTFSCLLFMAVLARCVTGAGEEPPSDVSVRAVGIRVVRETLLGEAEMTRFWGPAGTSVALQIRTEHKQILCFDAFSSRLEFLRDDRGNDLEIVSEPSRHRWQTLPGRDSESSNIPKIESAAQSFWPQGISKDKRLLIVEVRGRGLPAAGSCKVQAKGKVSLIIAEGLATTYNRDVIIRPGETIAGGPLSFRIVSVEREDKGTDRTSERNRIEALDEQRGGFLLEGPAEGPSGTVPPGGSRPSSGLIVTLSAEGSPSEIQSFMIDPAWEDTTFSFSDPSGESVKSTVVETRGNWFTEKAEVWWDIRLEEPLASADIAVKWWKGYEEREADFQVEAGLSLD